MGDLLLILKTVAIITTICCLIWLIISIRKKYTIGIIMPVTIILFLVYSFLDYHYISNRVSISKDDIIRDLKTLNLQLKDVFEIKQNIVSDAFGRTQMTKNDISNGDQLQLIEQIINSENFKELKYEEDI